MSHLTLEFTTLVDLRSQLSGFFDDDRAHAAGVPQINGLALYTTEELQAELTRRLNDCGEPVTANAPTPTQPPETVAKRRPGKKPSEAPAPAPAPAPVQMELPFEEPPLNVVNIKQAKEPDTASTSVAPSLPTEDDMLALMSEVYSKSGDMELVRGVMQEVGGKTQLSQIAPAVWPTLQARLLKERDRLVAGAA